MLSFEHVLDRSSNMNEILKLPDIAAKPITVRVSHSAPGMVRLALNV